LFQAQRWGGEKGGGGAGGWGEGGRGDQNPIFFVDVINGWPLSYEYPYEFQEIMMTMMS